MVPPMSVEAGTVARVVLHEDAQAALLLALVLELDPDDADAPSVDQEVARAVASAQEGPLDPERVRAIRDLLKFGRYRATGRGKPAHEFLHRAANDDAFPRVFPAVDVLNAVSLQHALPMSLVDLDLADTTRFRLRRGRDGESYVFNATGQSIDLKDLLLLATEDDDAPCANPVKDSLRTKLQPGSRRLLATIYAPSAARDWAEGAREALEHAYRRAFPSAKMERLEGTR